MFQPTPTFISTDPHMSNEELFPSFWICSICTALNIEKATVDMPAVNKAIRTIFCRNTICNNMKIANGIVNVDTSQRIVTVAVAYRASVTISCA